MNMKMSVKILLLVCGLMLTQAIFATHPLFVGQPMILASGQDYSPGEVQHTGGESFDRLFDRLKNVNLKNESIEYMVIIRNVEQSLKEVKKLDDTDPKKQAACLFMRSLIDEMRLKSYLNDLQSEVENCPNKALVEEFKRELIRMQEIKYKVPVYRKKVQQEFVDSLYIPGQVSGMQEASYDELFDQLVLMTNNASKCGVYNEKIWELHRQLLGISRDLIESDSLLYDQAVLAIRMILDSITIQEQELANQNFLKEKEDQGLPGDKLEIVKNYNLKAQNRLNFIKQRIIDEQPQVEEALIREYKNAKQRALNEQNPSIVEVANHFPIQSNPQKKDTKLQNYTLFKQVACGIGFFGVLACYIYSKDKKSALQLYKLQELKSLTVEQQVELEKLKSFVYRFKPKTVKDAVYLVGATVLAVGFMVS